MDDPNRKESQECRGLPEMAGRGIGLHSRGTPEALSFALSVSDISPMHTDGETVAWKLTNRPRTHGDD